MANSEKLPEPWLSFLRGLDAAATEETRLDCMGGFVVTQRYGFARPTQDVDVFELAPRAQLAPLLELGRRGGALHKKYGVYLDHVGVAKIPEEYESRLTMMFTGTGRAATALCARPVRPGVVQAGKKSGAGPPRYSAPGAYNSIGFESPQGTLRKGASLATGNTGARGLDTETVDGDG